MQEYNYFDIDENIEVLNLKFPENILEYIQISMLFALKNNCLQ